MSDNGQTDLTEKKAAEPLPIAADEDVLDWDAYSPPPPPKRSGKIQVHLRYVGRRKPIPVDFPDTDAANPET
jgi:hypothetical protein